MKLKEAIHAVETHALAILSQPNSNVRLVAVGAKNRRSLSEVTDFCITAYVPEKLTKSQLKTRNLVVFEKSVALAAGVDAMGGIELDVVESGSDFAPRQSLSAPAAFRGAKGGPTPTIDTQKFFNGLRCGIGITNPIDEYPLRLTRARWGSSSVTETSTPTWYRTAM